MADGLTTTFWMSFLDHERPEGSRFLGVVLVDADTLPEAISAAWRAGCNPGGEILSMVITPDDKRKGPPADVAILATLPRLTLLSRDQIEAAGMELVFREELERR